MVQYTETFADLLYVSGSGPLQCTLTQFVVLERAIMKRSAGRPANVLEEQSSISISSGARLRKALSAEAYGNPKFQHGAS